jgi:hypothetical protein
VTEAHTIVPLYQPPLTDWQRLTPAEKQDAVRRHVEIDGRTYDQAAKALGCSRVAIAGVVERSLRSPNPIRSGSGRKGAPRSKAKQKHKGSPNRRVKMPRRPHQGLTNLVPLGAPAEPYVPPPGAWDALPGSSPVPLAEIDRDACKWPVYTDRPYLFCALPVKADSPYCPEHSARAFRELPTLKKGNAE